LVALDSQLKSPLFEAKYTDFKAETMVRLGLVKSNIKTGSIGV
tara:strand:+ start:59 stop:187 length:129 start_codon:yes stop_codon:yes gene_type:complete